MTESTQELPLLLQQMAKLIENNDAPDPQIYAVFLQEPELSFQLIDFINQLSDDHQDDFYLYSASIFALDVCVTQLHSFAGSQPKNSKNKLNELMNYMAEVINQHNHSVSFWLPALNAFYETKTELTPALLEAYYDITEEEQTQLEESDYSHVKSIQQVIEELSDLNEFEIIEHFFAQSYAMPPEFFSELMMDLYSIDEGREIGLLCLLHPKLEVREVVVATMDHIIDEITLSSRSLTRLKAIKEWYPPIFHSHFDNWIKVQRKKEVVFEKRAELTEKTIHATEIDGSGSQGIFIQNTKSKQHPLAGLLFSYHEGIKDVWVTPEITPAEKEAYFHDAFGDSVTIRRVDTYYLKLLCEHFLAVTISQGHFPGLHLLEIQESLGIQLSPNKIDIDALIEEIGIQITPFTGERIEVAFKRTKSWLKTKPFTESWIEENPSIDKIVNRFCSIEHGVKVCQFDDAIKAVFNEEMEVHRDKWLFHFLWLSLWLKAKARKNEQTWQDSFCVAYAIHEGYPLIDIPVLKEICYQTILHSMETMQERRTHLSRPQ